MDSWSQLFQELRSEIHNVFLEFFNESNNTKLLGTDIKSDGTEVTEIDLRVSKLVHEKISKIKELSAFTFYCEEDNNPLSFPAIILDPIDGTKGLIKGCDECCVSLAIMFSASLEDERNQAWIYNPFTGLELSSQELSVQAREYFDKDLLFLISRSEDCDGLIKTHKADNITLRPKGSIALKLAFLSAGSCDGVLSLRDKNLWDIAAGSILCYRKGIFFYEKQVKVTELNKEVFSGPLVWFREEFSSVFASLKNNKVLD